MFQRSVNKVVLIGRLGGDPEVRYAPSGNAVANFSLATNRSYKNKEGSFENETTWHRIVVWGRLAELCKEYLKKGMQIYIDGRIQYREWEDQNGNKRNTTEVIAEQIQMLESSQKSGTESSTADEIPPHTNNDSFEGAPDEEVPF